MAYHVKIATRAERDLADLYEWIEAESSAAARKWYEGLNAAILGLEQRPYAWPAINESSRLRHLLYGRRPHRVYRVIYRIRERMKLVEIMHIRHGSRRPLNSSDLK